MVTFARGCGARVSRLSASQPDDGALRARSWERGNEPDDGDAGRSCRDVGALASDGRGDWLPDFKAQPAVSDASYWRAFHPLQPRHCDVVRAAFWPVTNTAMDKTFRKDLSHLSWDEVYARQSSRASLIADWLTALSLKPGNRVLEIGAGPGFVSFALAECVGPKGIVYALDQSAEALAKLKRRQNERGVAQIETIVADAATLQPDCGKADSVLITMVLHHAKNPAEIVRNAGQFAPPGAPIVIGEFHPDGPCSGGPPREHRLSLEKIQEWCGQAGLSVVAYRRQTPEHYMVVAHRNP